MQADLVRYMDYLRLLPFKLWVAKRRLQVPRHAVDDITIGALRVQNEQRNDSEICFLGVSISDSTKTRSR